MKRLLLISALLLASFSLRAGNTWIRVNLCGYLPDDVKVAVLISTGEVGGSFEVRDALTDELVLTGTGRRADASKWALASGWRLDFSAIETPGSYYIAAAGVCSPVFRIGPGVYDSTADFLLTYLRQQRCGDNPYNGHLCHQDDGYIVYHPTRTGEHIDVTGGWHDATDYLQYMTTSSTTIYHMAFAWKYAADRSVFGDRFDATGRPGANGIPDVIDEVKWGLDWLDKMNPAPREMYYQIADDRDHAGMRLPYLDSVDYGYGPGKGRPVYFVTGKPQIAGHKVNRTTGVSSAAGKFASTFALGADVIRQWYPEFAAKIEGKVQDAWDFALEVPGNTQTACVISPYFYEEDTWVDDVELAAATQYALGKGGDWLQKAAYWGELEPVSPWMERGRGPGKEYHHYQWYPFINLGHWLLATSDDEAVSAEFTGYLRQGLQDLRDRAADDPFMHGVPYLWCSNNLTSAAVTQARLYEKATGDASFREMEAALRDWLLGCNPWGTSMICGLPFAQMPGYDSPTDPHSSYVKMNGDLPLGGLIDGPIDRQLFLDRAGAALTREDDFEVLNGGEAVYHDDIGDYSSNEPTMDGTAGLVPYFSEREALGRTWAAAHPDRNESPAAFEKDRYGTIVRVNPDRKVIYLCFTADENFNGAETILNTLKKRKIKGNFFLTGNCLRHQPNREAVQRVIADGHYVGGHSDRHVLYCDWGSARPDLMSADSIAADLRANFAELARFGVKPGDARWFLPPYEHYNTFSVNVLEAMGVNVVNYTPGIGTPADYTTPDMKNYRDAQTLVDGLWKFEKEQGLNGALLLIHPGIDARRPEGERLYNRLDEIIRYLKRKGYSFERLP
ncbi:MAG: glycoside hydrolase family 9 protein [Bacteroidales bacterium]|nr:glycoside hydrolase family 9 protein [Bacteroidales bacterium]